VDKGVLIFLINNEFNVQQSMKQFIKEDAFDYYYEGVLKDLKLELHAGLPHKPQRGKSCAWTSTATPTLRSLLYIRCLHKKMSHEEALITSAKMYKSWRRQDVKQNLQEFLDISLSEPEDIQARRKLLTCFHKYLTSLPEKSESQELIKMIEKEILLNAAVTVTIPKLTATPHYSIE
jgi:hypothetical protein